MKSREQARIWQQKYDEYRATIPAQLPDINTHLCILIDIFISRFAKKPATFFIFSFIYLHISIFFCIFAP